MNFKKWLNEEDVQADNKNQVLQLPEMMKKFIYAFTPYNPRGHLSFDTQWQRAAGTFIMPANILAKKINEFLPKMKEDDKKTKVKEWVDKNIKFANVSYKFYTSPPEQRSGYGLGENKSNF
jgi:hypothetical protein